MAQVLTLSTAIAPALIEPTPSYFSRYHACVVKAWSTPLMGARDLVGRVVILTTTIGGYVVAAVLSIPYWLNEQRAIRTMIYSSHKHDHPRIALPKDEMLQFCDIRNIREEEYSFRGDLSAEKSKIQGVMQDPKIQPLLTYISRAEKKLRSNALASLFVILGIKPALVFEANSSLDPALITLLQEISGGHLILREERSDRYFVNERPLAFFDPHRFLTLLPTVSLAEAVIHYFPRQNQLDSDQMLSYLLGFGPSFEAYATNCSYVRHSDPVKCCLNENHYYEIGKVLYQHFFHKIGDNLQLATLAFAYHCQVVTLFRRYQWANDQPVRPVHDLLKNTGTTCFLDGVAARTDYFKKSYTLKEWVMETYFTKT